MTYKFALALILCSTLSACQAENSLTATPSLTAAVGSESQCAALAGTGSDTASIEKAEWFNRGAPMLSLMQRTMLAAVAKDAPPFDAPVSFCRVTAKLRQTPDSRITVGVWLPQLWNGKMLGAGGGGFNGGLNTGALVFKDPLARGYVGVATDAGHDETPSARFAYDSPESLKDYGYRANHLGAEFAKALITTYYGSQVKSAFFHGCSNGGRDALMLAQRFPKDYDAIIAGAPSADASGLINRFVWNRQVVAATPTLSSKLKLVHRAVIAKCDGLDGANDGLLENPSKCNFDPAELQCKSGDGPDCLSAAEVDALRKIYQGPRLADGTQVYHGQPVGSEALQGGWDGWIIGDKLPSLGPEALRWMVHQDPSWTIERFDLAHDTELARKRIGPIVDAIDPDLRPFLSRGGKLLMYHGWNDAAIPAGATLDYYAKMRKVTGPAADAQTRLFMVPGLLHCAGGPGATSFKALDALERWTETEIAPERIIATEYDAPSTFFVSPNAKKVRTRPLCPWPKAAVYSGSGSRDSAENFNCK